MMSLSASGIELKKLYSQFSVFRREQKFCDVAIKVQTQTYLCHRVILASALEYFRNMFSGNFCESAKDEIELKGISALDFELLLAHIYGESVSLANDNVYRLLRIGHYVRLESLENLCVKYLLTVALNSLTMDLIVKIFLYASKMRKTALTNRFRKHIAENFINFSKDARFLHVPGNELMLILADQNLEKDANATLDFLTNWLTKQPTRRDERIENRKLLLGLLNAFDFEEPPVAWLEKTLKNISKIPSPYMMERMLNIKEELVDEDDLANGEQTCDLFVAMDAVDDFETHSDSKTDAINLPFTLYTCDAGLPEKRLHNGGTAKPYLNLYKFRPRCYPEVQLVKTFTTVKSSLVMCRSVFVGKLNFIITADPIENNFPFHTFEFQAHLRYESGHYALKSRRSKITNQTQLDDNFTVTSHGSNIYLYNVGELLMYHCETDEWCDMSETEGLKKTAYSNLLSYQDSLYMVGGKRTRYQNPLESLDEVNLSGKVFQRLDLREGKWKQLPATLHAHCKPASCIHNDVLYVSGGEGLSYFNGSVEYFDFRAHKWHPFESPMLEPKWNHVILGHDDQLWFFGGRKYVNSAHVLLHDVSWYFYNLTEHAWSDVHSLPSTYGRLKPLKFFDVVVNV